MKKLFIIHIDSELYVVEAEGKGEFTVLPIKGEKSSTLQGDPKEQISELISEIIGVLGEDDLGDIAVTLIYSKDMQENVQNITEELFRQDCKRLEIAMLEPLLPTLLLKTGKLSLGEEKVVSFGNLTWNIAIDEHGKSLEPKSVEATPNKDLVLHAEDIPKAYLADFTFTSGRRDLEHLNQQLNENSQQYKELKSNFDKLKEELSMKKSEIKSLESRLLDEFTESTKNYGELLSDLSSLQGRINEINLQELDLLAEQIRKKGLECLKSCGK